MAHQVTARTAGRKTSTPKRFHQTSTSLLTATCLGSIQRSLVLRQNLAQKTSHLPMPSPPPSSSSSSMAACASSSSSSSDARMAP